MPKKKPSSLDTRLNDYLVDKPADSKKELVDAMNTAAELGSKCVENPKVGIFLVLALAAGAAIAYFQDKE